MALIYWILVVAVCLQRIAELFYSRRNQALLRATGFTNREPSAQFSMMVLVHVGWIAGMLIEPFVLHLVLPDAIKVCGLFTFLSAQVLRFWTLRSLGRQWNVNVMRPASPAAHNLPVVSIGPYRYVRHPNYTAVILEIVSLPLVGNAIVTATAATLANLIVLCGRIKTEEGFLLDDPNYRELFEKKPRFIPGLY